jgi:ergothioneine biosynthesis protein EgtB
MEELMTGPEMSAQATTPGSLRRRYEAVRGLTEALALPLSPEDQGVQSMADASPTKWHLAHTTWFFERMILASRRGYKMFDSRYDALFNSYYLGIGTPMTRAERGLLTRPSAREVVDYRHYVNSAVLELIDRDEAEGMIELGLQHEQQHQELILTDIKHAFWGNPLRPAYCPALPSIAEVAPPLEWWEHRGGQIEVGHGDSAFAFDNERPRHVRTVQPFRLASRLVTCGEYLEFIHDGGYDRHEFWHSEGWSVAKAEGWRAPLYWMPDGNVFTLHGLRTRNPAEPVAHVSYYEAAAYAAWANKRLPTEFEWEAAASDLRPAGHFLEIDALLPRPAKPGKREQMFGDAWEWTCSSYDPYPGFTPFDGAAVEYNGKFMVGQLVLRGGSCVTPPHHVRATYRNFFPPSARWQFSGIRLAEDA